MKKMMCATLLATGVLAACNVVAEDFFYIEIGVAKNLGDNGWVGDYPAHLSLGYVKEFKDTYIKFDATHISNLEKGRPFNNEYESYLDITGISFGLRF